MFNKIFFPALVLCSIVALLFLPETAPARLGGEEYASWPSLSGEVPGAGVLEAETAATS